MAVHHLDSHPGALAAAICVGGDCHTSILSLLVELLLAGSSAKAFLLSDSTPGSLSPLRAKLETAAGNPENQDRGAVIESSIGLVLVVADSAGGQSGVTEAAIMAVESVRREANELRDANACITLLRDIDQAICKDRVAGETTCVLAVVTPAAV